MTTTYSIVLFLLSYIALRLSNVNLRWSNLKTKNWNFGFFLKQYDSQEVCNFKLKSSKKFGIYFQLEDFTSRMCNFTLVYWFFFLIWILLPFYAFLRTSCIILIAGKAILCASCVILLPFIFILHVICAISLHFEVILRIICVIFLPLEA
jgi:hypothetical protein